MEQVTTRQSWRRPARWSLYPIAVLLLVFMVYLVNAANAGPSIACTDPTGALPDPWIFVAGIVGVVVGRLAAWPRYQEVPPDKQGSARIEQPTGSRILGALGLAGFFLAAAAALYFEAVHGLAADRPARTGLGERQRLVLGRVPADAVDTASPLSAKPGLLRAVEEVPNPRFRRRSRSYASRLRWLLVVGVFIAGIILWLAGVTWGAALPGLALIGFVVAAWLDVRPQGGHVHDTGLSAYGVAEPPRIEVDEP